MDINKLKDADPKQLMAGFVLLCMLPLLYFWYAQRKGEKNPSAPEQVALETTNSQYETKLAAFKAKQKERREHAGQIRQLPGEMNTFGSETESEQTQETGLSQIAQEKAREPEVPLSKPTVVRERKGGVSNQIRQEGSVAQQLRNTVTTEMSEDEPVAQKEAAYSERERRRQEMIAGWNRNQSKTSNSAKTYKGVIHGTQELSGGQIAQLRTKEEIRVRNTVIPVNTLISGKVRIESGRLMIQVSSVRLRNDIVSVPMTVYGSDGQPGLATALDVTDNTINRELTDEAISQVRRTGVIGSIASSVATAVTKDKNQRVKLIDAQTIYFKLKEQ